MKSLLFIIILGLATFLLSSSAPLLSNSYLDHTPVTYQQQIRPIFATHCLSCHGNRESKKRQLDTYDTVKEKIDDILYRVQLEPSNRKFMPYKMRQAPLTRAEIAVLQAWKDGGMRE
jgi:mono/diheme cytochrome c family protein